MEGVSIIIPVFNKLEITRKCIDHIREFNKNYVFEIIIVDNGSTDETPDVLSKGKDLIYLRNTENLGISKGCNIGSKTAGNRVLCFMHNDVFIFKKNWIAEIHDFISKTPNVGIVGLYGAKTLRKDGSFRGKTIVHSKKDSPSIVKSFERVAVVDGLLMAIQVSVFEKIGGFNEVFPIHYYDKDISLRAFKNNFVNYVLNIPYEHQCAVSRKEIKEENKIREEARNVFIKIWEDFLPMDVNTWQEKLTCIFKGVVK